MLIDLQTIHSRVKCAACKGTGRADGIPITSTYYNRFCVWCMGRGSGASIMIPWSSVLRC
jgi:DnaJ-class molecular chaperone